MKQVPLLILCLLIFITAAAQDSTKRSFLVRTTGLLPSLEYGPGDDRLGGARMGYLDSNVVLKVEDSLGSDYIVRLSKYHTAFISKASAIRDTTLRSKPWYLSGSFMVTGNDEQDIVSINLDERLPYRTQQEINPARIVIDIYGATSNTNWITQRNSAKEIKNTWYEQKEDDVLRIFIELNSAQHWGYQVGYDSTTRRLQIKVKRPPEKKKLRNLVIAIDAGHGGANTGAAGKTTKILEKDYTLRFAQELEKVLGRKKARVFMTRSTDVDLNMVDRTLMLRKQQPDLLISLHLNSSGNPNIKGTSTYYRYIGFRPLTQTIYNRMLELGLEEFGNIGGFNFALSGPTEYPNCLVEVAFLSNEEDEKRIQDPAFHKAVAKKIERGIRDWLKSM